jgi:hypothetical protein
MYFFNTVDEVIKTAEKEGLKFDLLDGRLKVIGENISPFFAEEIKAFKTLIIQYLYEQLTSRADELKQLIDEQGQRQHIQEFRELLNKIIEAEKVVSK